MLTLGIHDGHNASACLLKDSEVLFALGEERVTNKKNQSGVPAGALAKLFEQTKIEPVLNTSFNLHGFPIVGTPEVAIKTYLSSGLDALAIGGFLLKK